MLFICFFFRIIWHPRPHQAPQLGFTNVLFLITIHKFIGKDYSRVRIGIGKPKENIEVGDFVLQNFDEEELSGIEKISNHINESISLLVEKKLDLFSSTVNNNK